MSNSDESPSEVTGHLSKANRQLDEQLAQNNIGGTEDFEELEQNGRDDGDNNEEEQENNDDQDEADDGTIYEVERIVEMRQKTKNKRLFRIRWKGYSAKHDTWEPEENLQGAKERIEEFFKLKGIKPDQPPPTRSGLRNRTFPAPSTSSSGTRRSTRISGQNQPSYTQAEEKEEEQEEEGEKPKKSDSYDANFKLQRGSKRRKFESRRRDSAAPSTKNPRRTPTSSTARPKISLDAYIAKRANSDVDLQWLSDSADESDNGEEDIIDKAWKMAEKGHSSDPKPATKAETSGGGKQSLKDQLRSSSSAGGASSSNQRLSVTSGQSTNGGGNNSADSAAMKSSAGGTSSSNQRSAATGSTKSGGSNRNNSAAIKSSAGDASSSNQRLAAAGSTKGSGSNRTDSAAMENSAAKQRSNNVENPPKRVELPQNGTSNQRAANSMHLEFYGMIRNDVTGELNYVVGSDSFGQKDVRRTFSIEEVCAANPEALARYLHSRVQYLPNGGIHVPVTGAT